MRIVVSDGTGERYSYDTDKDSMCLYPAADEKPEVARALEEASAFLSGSLVEKPRTDRVRLVYHRRF